ncbi:YaiO family outer membrane beta-barrel protein [Foetidibacter luteolus]|uniref:YaiO family outer membrane beta-barrel protein n=1 Tax=Foetidibacter luteolus TaxID=2608880 RepID=UPI001A99EF72|nr:YaiO family outer membrane beta-barrel protein [Foetidibacter luteolus]
MKNPILIFLGKTCLLFFILPAFITAQAQTDTNTADGLFQAARKAAFDEKNYILAKQYCHKALAISPGYADIRVFLGRLYTWDKQLDSARQNFDYIINSQKDYADVYAAYTDLEYWNNNNTAALAKVNDGLQQYPNSTELLLKKAKVLDAMRNYKEAGATVDKVLAADKQNTEALAIANRIRDNRSLNRIGINYDYVYFTNFEDRDPWHLASIDYSRQTALGSVTARINYANRFRENGVQYEVDAYPRISKMFYSYVSGGYSDNVGVFPKWRAGFSLYANLPKSFEAEAGLRYLYFSSSTTIYTVYIGKYYKNYLFGFRTYLTPGNSNISQSYNITGRYYYGGADDYIGLTAGTGISPDDRLLNQQLNSKYQLKTYRASLELRHAIKLNILTFNFSINNQEYRKDYIGNQIQAGIGYMRRF